MINFNRPYATGREFAYIEEAIANLHLSGNGPFDGRCRAWLEERTGAARAFLTASGSSALEMAALLAGLEPGDEVEVEVNRDGERRSFDVELGTRPGP